MDVLRRSTATVRCSVDALLYFSHAAEASRAGQPIVDDNGHPEHLSRGCAPGGRVFLSTGENKEPN